jgi:hypothetical protein
MMTDKYEEFKEWFKHHPTDEDEIDLVFAIGNLFKEFEEELKEKDKEKKVKEIIRDSIVTTPLTSTSLPKPHELYCSDELVNKLFNKLKGEGLLK